MYRRLKALLILSLAVLLTGGRASAQTTAETKITERVRGRVINRVTHEPVPRALVFSSDSFATLTDGEGRFEFTFPASSTADPASPPNELSRPGFLMARKPGYLDDRRGRQYGESVAVDKDRELTIWLMPESLIVGRVNLPASDVSEQIQVEVYRRLVQDGHVRWTPTGSVTTTSDGEFRFSELEAGSYKLFTHEQLDRDPLTFDPRGQLYGYPPVYFPNAPDMASGGTIQLSAGEVFQADITLARQPYYRVKIATANPQSENGMDVRVSSQGHKGPGYSLGYNPDEHSIEGMLPNGTYSLEASTSGQNPAFGILNFTVKGAAVEGLRLALSSGTTINVNVKEEFTSKENSGSVVWEVNGRQVIPKGPRRYLNVVLEAMEEFVEGRTLSLPDPTGRENDTLLIENAPPGRYWVRIHSTRGFASAVSSGTVDLRQQPLVVGGGGPVSPIEVTMRDDGADIEGEVESAALTSSRSETPSAYVYCIPLPDGSGEYREIPLSASNVFSSSQLPPGTYRVLAFDRPQPEMEYRNSEAMRAYDGKGLVVRLVAGQKEHLRLHVIATGE